MAHEQMRFHLAHGIEHDTDHDEQAGATEKLAGELRNTEIMLHGRGKNGENGEEDGTRQGEARHGVIEEVGSRRHLAMSGYLQNGEAVAMKLATLKWHHKLIDYDARLVNFVHDEWQVECPNNMEIALTIARMLADSLKTVGEDLNLRCPLAGSYWNDDLKDYTIDLNWSKTH